MEMTREWAMPNAQTFCIPPIRKFLERWLPPGIVIDPFSGTSTLATHRNDLAYEGMDAIEWLDSLASQKVIADAVLLDPPYSPRQMSEVYKSAGLNKGMGSSQNAKLYKEAKLRLTQLLKPNGVALSFGWNSSGFGKNLGFEMMEILLVSHGAAHNDTICVAEILTRY